MLRIGYKIKRFRVWISNKMSKFSERNIPPEDTANSKGIFIVKRLISELPSELSLAPISGKYYLKNQKKDIFAIISQKSISIINGKYHYDFSISDYQYGNLISMFNNRIERDRLKMENEIRSKIERSLDQIIKTHWE